MERYTLDEYLKLPIIKKKEYLTSVLGNKNARVLGKVIRLEDNFCKVADIIINASDENHLFIPFKDEKEIKEIMSSYIISKELNKKNIKKGEFIFFTVIPNAKNYEEEGRFFTIKENSISIAVDCEKLYESIELPVYDSVLYSDFAKDYESNKIYFSKDLETVYERELNIVKELNLEKEAIGENIAGLREEIDNLGERYEAELDKNNKKLEAEYKSKSLELETKQKNEIQSLLEEKEKIEKEISFLKRNKIIQGEEEKLCYEEEEFFEVKDIEDRIDYIQGYLMANDENPLYYDKSIIKSFYAGLRSNQIIILAGKPGSGKTSFVESFADAVNAKISLIPVQPNWMDKSDLLGFYNPIEKSYISTPFLDALINASNEAKDNSDKMFFICLDEMNLSHIEYYFAEFLSKLQTDRKIQLYSKDLYESLKEEINDRTIKFKCDIKDLTIDKFLSEQSNESIDNYINLKNQYKMLKKYPYEVDIPKNIKFIGTINKDETTKDFSPKVTDRSFIIKIENNKGEKRKITPEDMELFNSFSKKINLKYSDIGLQVIKSNDELESIVTDIKEKLFEFDIHVSNRFDKTLKEIYDLESFSNTDEVLDMTIASLILPKINHTEYDTDLDKLQNVLKDICVGKPISLEILKWMNKNSGSDMFTYWR